MNLRLALVVVLAARGGGLVWRRSHGDLLLLSLKVPHLIDDQRGLMYPHLNSHNVDIISVQI